MDETDEQFDERLSKVIARADTTFYTDDYVWRRLEAGRAPSWEALACVADGGTWHEFVPATAETEGRFCVVLFRFAEDGPSAIGFVAWLHTHLRTTGRTGAIVICGKDRRASPKLDQICQGAMDYWACPVGPTGTRFLGVIHELIEHGRALGGRESHSLPP
ncbi:MAG: DUF6196 family protein [Pseudomonadota bacterium]